MQLLLRHSKNILFFLLIYFHLPEAFAQQVNELKGQVNDESGQPITGASVTAVNTATRFSSGTQSDSLGIFHFYNLPAGGPYTFEISYVGFMPQQITGYTIRNGGNVSLLVKLKAIQTSLDQVVVVGYGTQRKSVVTGSISSVKARDIKDMAVTNYDQALVGKMAGVQAVQTTGQPGQGLTFRIRGVGSMSTGTEPIIVLDGVPLDRQSQALELVNTQDVESIEVLKDASSAAIYGSRGANGVIMITTKSGKEGAPKISYSNITGLQQVAKKIKMMDAYQFALVAKDGHDNAWVDFAPGNSASTPDAERGTVENGLYWNQTPPDLYPYINGEPGLTNTDWQDAIFRNALLTNQTLSATGGTKNVKYYASLNYSNQQGIIINSNYKRYSARVNLDVTRNRLNFGLNFVPSYSIENRVDANSNTGVVANALQILPIFPVYNADGSYNFDSYGKLRVGKDYQHNAILNPVAQANLQKNEVYHTNVLGKFYAGYKLSDDLKYNLALSVTANNYSNDRYTPRALPNNFQNYPDFSIVNSSSGTASNTNIFNWAIEHTLNYIKKINQHNINAMLGYSSQKNSAKGNSVTAVNYINDLNTTVNGGQISAKEASVEEWSLISYIGRVQYDFAGKYLASVSLRSDGSSRFGPNNRYGYFPAASIGWRLSSEKFMDNLQAISNLKLRASYGSTGNFQINNYDHISLISQSDYRFGAANGTRVVGLIPQSVSNPDLSWEVSSMFNGGLDIGLFKQKLTIEIEYYDRRTSNLLLNLPVPFTTGFATARQNIGKVQNKGVDISIGGHNNFGALQWDANLNFSVNRNKVLALGPENAPIITTSGSDNTYFITQVGSPIGSYYLLKTNGVFLNQADLDSYPHFANTRAGDFKFVDIDGDGVLDVNKDRTIVGDYYPDFTYGFTNNFSYKNFDLAFSLQGAQGVKILNLLRRFINNMEGNTNGMAEDAANRWRSESTPGSGFVNRANRKSKGNNGRSSTWHVEDGSYLRMQNVTLGFTLPAHVTDKINIGTARIFFTGQNLFTLTKYSGYNPEVSLNAENELAPGLDYGSYPLTRTYSFGINVNF